MLWEAIAFAAVGGCGDDSKIARDVQTADKGTAQWQDVIDVMLDARRFRQPFCFSIDRADRRVIYPLRCGRQFGRYAFRNQGSDTAFIGAGPLRVALCAVLLVVFAPFPHIFSAMGSVVVGPLLRTIRICFPPRAQIFETLITADHGLRLIAGLAPGFATRIKVGDGLIGLAGSTESRARRRACQPGLSRKDTSMVVRAFLLSSFFGSGDHGLVFPSVALGIHDAC